MSDLRVVFWDETVAGGLDQDEDAWSGRPQSATLRIQETFRGVGEREYVTIALSCWESMCSPMPYRLGERTLYFGYDEGQGLFRTAFVRALSLPRKIAIPEPMQARDSSTTDDGDAYRVHDPPPAWREQDRRRAGLWQLSRTIGTCAAPC